MRSVFIFCIWSRARAFQLNVLSAASNAQTRWTHYTHTAAVSLDGVVVDSIIFEAALCKQLLF